APGARRRWRHPISWPLRPLPEQARRAEQQHGYEDQEDADLAEALAEEQTAERLRDADDEPAEERADEAAHAAQHDNGEGDQHEGMADMRARIIGWQQEARGGAETGDADAEAHGVDMRGTDPDELRAPRLLGEGTDRLAEIGFLHEKPE